MADPRILVVEDSPTMRRIILSQLKKAVYTRLGEAEDGLDALDELEVHLSVVHGRSSPLPRLRVSTNESKA